MITTSDRELLALAAEAARYKVRWIEGATPLHYTGFMIDNGKHVPSGFEHEIRWNPLTDDGDALRLATATMICVEFGYCQDSAPIIRCGYIEDRDSWKMYPNFPNPHIATRRAIVTAAAEIQKQNEYWTQHDSHP